VTKFSVGDWVLVKARVVQTFDSVDGCVVAVPGAKPENVLVLSKYIEAEAEMPEPERINTALLDASGDFWTWTDSHEEGEGWISGGSVPHTFKAVLSAFGPLKVYRGSPSD